MTRYARLDQPRKSQLGSISQGVAGIRETLIIMQQLSNRFKKNMTIRGLAAMQVRFLPGKDTMQEVAAIYSWVQGNIRFLSDIHDCETLQEPTATIEIGQGDCDDMSTLLASMLLSIGIPARYVAAAYYGINDFEHVYVEAYVNGEWIGLDPTEPVAPGYVPAGEVNRIIQDAS